jgi:hypothetical protein
MINIFISTLLESIKFEITLCLFKIILKVMGINNFHSELCNEHVKRIKNRYTLQMNVKNNKSLILW